jgi:hypothetical protein
MGFDRVYWIWLGFKVNPFGWRELRRAMKFNGLAAVVYQLWLPPLD